MQSTHEMIQQADADLRRADTRLNAAYRKLLARLDGIGQMKLKKAQRAWLAFRDASATFYADEMRGGTGETPIYIGVQARMTAERAAELEKYLAGLGRR